MNEQKLIDICFEIALTVTDEFTKLSNAEKAAYVAKQLKGCGFDTVPCGASWGVLEPRNE
jgi:hypothetical protein